MSLANLEREICYKDLRIEQLEENNIDGDDFKDAMQI